MLLMSEVDPLLINALTMQARRTPGQQWIGPAAFRWPGQ